MTIWFLWNINVVITKGFVFCKREITIECHTAHNKVRFWKGIYAFPKLVSLMILVGGLLGNYFQLVLCGHCCLMVTSSLIKQKFLKNRDIWKPGVLRTAFIGDQSQILPIAFQTPTKILKYSKHMVCLGDLHEPRRAAKVLATQTCRKDCSLVKWQPFLRFLHLSASLCTRHNFKQHL